MRLLLKIFFCMFVLCLGLFAHLEKQNELTELKMEIPQLQRAVRRLREENERLEYEIDRFESPLNLVELAKRPEFGHFNAPYIEDVMTIQGAE